MRLKLNNKGQTLVEYVLIISLITVVAIAAVIGFFWIMWPNIQNSLNTQWNNISGAPAGTIVVEK